MTASPKSADHVDDGDFLLEPHLQNIVDSDLEWIFVGGKGGVGKTTTSCSLAIQLAKKRESVLLLSTDPAHNISDAFEQKFSSEPTLIKGFENLYAMEVDPSHFRNQLGALGTTTETVDENGEIVAQEPSNDMMSSMMQDMIGSFPGIEEAMSFAELMKYVQDAKYSCIVFDTAPTGHTLRLLGFPAILERGLGKLHSLMGAFGPIIASFSAMMNQQGGASGPQLTDIQDMSTKLQSLREATCSVIERFKDADKTTFVSVMIPEFLSLYETERLIQELASHEMDTSNLVVNQIIYPSQCGDCSLCTASRRKQAKYLKQISELYGELFHICWVPKQEDDILGKDALEKFSELLVTGRSIPDGQ